MTKRREWTPRSVNVDAPLTLAEIANVTANAARPDSLALSIGDDDRAVPAARRRCPVLLVLRRLAVADGEPARRQSGR